MKMVALFGSSTVTLTVLPVTGLYAPLASTARTIPLKLTLWVGR